MLKGVTLSSVSTVAMKTGEFFGNEVESIFTIRSCRILLTLLHISPRQDRNANYILSESENAVFLGNLIDMGYKICF